VRGSGREYPAESVRERGWTERVNDDVWTAATSAARLGLLATGDRPSEATGLCVRCGGTTWRSGAREHCRDCGYDQQVRFTSQVSVIRPDPGPAV
jgi:hypothetical protein